MESFDTLFIELGTNMPLLQHNNEKNNINRNQCDVWRDNSIG